jgi:hypothetical protein
MRSLPPWKNPSRKLALKPHFEYQIGDSNAEKRCQKRPGPTPPDRIIKEAEEHDKRRDNVT